MTKNDVVVVYKADRLSRSLLDFARLPEVFVRQRVSFVSVTRSRFTTAQSLGRLPQHAALVRGWRRHVMRRFESADPEP